MLSEIASTLLEAIRRSCLEKMEDGGPFVSLLMLMLLSPRGSCTTTSMENVGGIAAGRSMRRS